MGPCSARGDSGAGLPDHDEWLPRRPLRNRAPCEIDTLPPRTEDQACRGRFAHKVSWEPEHITPLQSPIRQLRSPVSENLARP